MALKRAILKGMGLTDEQVEAIMEGHLDSVNGLKDELKTHEGDAARIKALEDRLKAREGGENKPSGKDTGEDYEAKYNDVKREFDAYKADVEGRETLNKVKAAYKTLLTEEKIDPSIHDLILRGTDFSGKKLDADGKLENAEKLREDIRKDYAAHRVTTQTRGANAGGQGDGQGSGGTGGMSKEQIMAIKDTGERQRAIAENHEMFGF